jgi:hypothetical protein
VQQGTWGAYLAEFIVSNLDRRNEELDVGGPEILTQNEMAKAAFAALNKKKNILHTR